METTQKAQDYLDAILSGILPNGYTIQCDDSDVGLAFTLFPKNEGDWGKLIGYQGKTIRSIKRIMKIWGKNHAPNREMHVWTPSPRMIEKED